MEKQNRKRDRQLVFRVTADEKAFIQEKMQSIGMTNFREYARRMATKGHIINVDSTEIKSLSAELQRIDVNVRQILRHIDRMGATYAADAEDIRVKMGESWDIVRRLFREASKLSQK
ncbi:MAG: plasmid mobilization relaxosome protein MobC [Defluviitaleaceae bacterium]|nr:plasmid mobilization relaxosome protein MobC [Defluviitaleaceae bacterium]